MDSERVALDDFNSIPSDTHLVPIRGKQRRIVLRSAAQIEREEIRWLFRGRVPLGMVTILSGVGGLGKSQWTCLLAAELSRGHLLGEPAATIIASAEDSWSMTIRPRLEAVQADLELIHSVTVATKDGEEGIAIPDDLGELQEMVEITGAKLLVIDPLVAHLPSRIDSHRDQDVRRALHPLYRLADSTGCAVIALVHLNKAQGSAVLSRLSGSVGFGNAPRSVLVLDRDKDDPKHKRVLAHAKCNVGREQAALVYQVRPILLPPVGTAPSINTSCLTLVDEIDLDAEELINGVFKTANDSDTALSY